MGSVVGEGGEKPYNLVYRRQKAEFNYKPSCISIFFLLEISIYLQLKFKDCYGIPHNIICTAINNCIAISLHVEDKRVSSVINEIFQDFYCKKIHKK